MHSGCSAALYLKSRSIRMNILMMHSLPLGALWRIGTGAAYEMSVLPNASVSAGGKRKNMNFLLKLALTS